jgi:hypothetical protein
LAGGNGATASVREKFQSPSNVAEEKMRRRRCRRRRRRASPSVGVSGEQVNGSGDAVPLFLGPVVKRKRQGCGGGRRHCGGKRASYPHPRIYTEEAKVMGIVGSVPLPDRFRSKSPGGGMEWGGGFYNRAPGS